MAERDAADIETGVTQGPSAGPEVPRERVKCDYPGCNYKGLRKNIHRHTKNKHKTNDVRMSSIDIQPHNSRRGGAPTASTASGAPAVSTASGAPAVSTASRFPTASSPSAASEALSQISGLTDFFDRLNMQDQTEERKLKGVLQFLNCSDLRILTSMDLRLVAGYCRNVEQVDLRDFHLSAESLSQLGKNNSSSLREVILPVEVTEEELEALLEPLEALKKLQVSAPRAGGSRWLRALPDTLVELNITGPGVTLSPVTWPPADGLSLRIREVTDRELNHLRVIASRVTRLELHDCPGVTAGAVSSLLAGLTHLMHVALGRGLDGAVTEAALDGLRGCSQLWGLILMEPLTDVPAAAVGRLAVSCQRLRLVCLNSPLDTCREMLNTLLAAQHDIRDSAGQPRNIGLHVPETVFNSMTKPPSGSNIELDKWP